MSDTDSFIEEVTEELRRDQLFRLMRRYGWIAILLVLLLVGGAAYNEWRKARDTAAAQALGDAILEATRPEDPAERARALAALETGGAARAPVLLLAAAEALEAGDRALAGRFLADLSADSSLPPVWRDLAALKEIMIAAEELPPETRLERLAPLAAPGAPYRLLAEEQMALAEIESDRRAAALERLRAILADEAATAGLRRRATQLIVALGGDPQAA